MSDRGDGRLWRITEKGVRYLNGEKVNRWVKVFDEKILEWSEETIKITEADGYYKPPPYWAMQYEVYNQQEARQQTFNW